MSIAAAVVAVAAVGILFGLYLLRPPKLIQAALLQHQHEVQDSSPKWVTDPDEIELLLGSARVPVGFAPIPPKANLCKVNNLLFAHFVYSRGAAEESLFLSGLFADPSAKSATYDIDGYRVERSENSGVTAIRISQVN